MATFDNNLNAEIISEADFQNLVTLKPNEAKTNPIKKSYHKITTLKRRACLVARGTPNKKYRPEILRTETKIILPPTYLMLKRLLPKISSNDGTEEAPIYTMRKIKIEQDEFATLLSMFTIFPIIGPIYENYVLDPDTCISFDIKNVSLSNVRIPGQLMYSDVRASVHLLIVLMGKSFPKNSPSLATHTNSFMTNRLRAIRFAIKDQNAKFLFDAAGIENMLTLWNKVPKLKRTIFLTLNALRGEPEVSKALSLLDYASMTTIQCILEFINATMLCRAHMIGQICEEISTFTAACQKVKDEMQDMWPHYRVFKPDDDTLHSAKFPNLAKAAVIYCKKFVNTKDSFQRLHVPNHKTVPNLESAAQTLLGENCYRLEDQLANVSEEAKQVARNMGIILENWRHPTFMERDDLNRGQQQNLQQKNAHVERLIARGLKGQAPNNG